MILSPYIGLAKLPPDKIIVVTQSFEGNLPGLAKKLYGNSNHWEILLWANGLKNPLALPTGTKLKVPKLKDALALMGKNGFHAGMT